MTVRLTNQVQRLSYTRRDIELIDEEVDRFITKFIPVIKNTSSANVGRLFLRIVSGLVDKLNYSLDQRFRQSVLRSVQEQQAALDITELVRYIPSKVSAAIVDLTVTAIGGSAPVGGISIPQFQVFFTETSPIKQFISLEAASIEEGGISTTVSAVQGVRTANQTILAAATGEESEQVTLPTSRTPVTYLEIKVDGVDFTRVDDFRESEQEDRHYSVSMDEDLFLTITFGDGTYGTRLTPGAQVTATYIQCEGEDGNLPSGFISKTTGTLASQVYVINDERSSGGSDGDTVSDIVRKAPLEASSMNTASGGEDFASLAQSVSGVFKALSDEGDGSLVNVYIMPSGGGVASSALLVQTEAYLQDRAIHGATVNVESLLSAHILVSMRVVLLTSNVDKAVARKKIYEAISSNNLDGSTNEDGALYYRNLTIGRGFALSDMARILEDVDDGELVDYVDFLKFTRYPTVIASDISTPEFIGEIVPGESAGYTQWKVVAVTTTTFYVYKAGVQDSNVGTVGVEYSSSSDEITFTLGQSTDTFTIGDTWTFKTSAYNNNIYLDDFEFMELARDSDLSITIYYPDEYSIGQS